MNRNLFKAPMVVVLAFLLLFGHYTSAIAQKMSAEDIIAKHLTSIGSDDAVKNSKLRLAIGGSEFVMPTLAKTAHGRAVLASNGAELAFFSTFDLRDYTRERIGLFGNKVSIPMISVGRRSPLGTFLAIHDRLLTDRIFGSLVFSTWLFLQHDQFGGRLETEGKKKIGDRDVWVVKYSPKIGLSSSDSYIKLYFDAENYHHLRTVYRQKETDQGFHDTVAAAPTFGWTADMANNGVTITEDFEDFRVENGLTLPHKYKIDLRIDGSTGTNSFGWIITIEEYRNMKEFPQDFFSFKG